MRYKNNTSRIMQTLLEQLFPITRSITGSGNRKTLKIIKDIIPIKIKEIKSGTRVYDWVVPKEWNIKSAWIKDSRGNKLIDFKENNLHLVGYSSSINKKLKWKDLKKHLHTNLKRKNTIEYRTSYYKKHWGFSITGNQYEIMKKMKGEFHVFIDSSFKKGSLSYGELLIKGNSKKEILISTYICHPSMANDNLSGILCTTFLAKHISNIKNLKWSYRIIFIPETIGAISYCKVNENKIKKIDYGLVISNVGGPGKFGYKSSLEEDSFINNEVEEVFYQSKKNFYRYPFDISGSDERQYSTQGFNINSITITKDKYYEYPQYHTSDDNLKFVNGIQINQSLDLYIKLIHKIEKWRIFKSNYVHGEIMLSKRNFDNGAGGSYLPSSKMSFSDLILWIISLSNGKVPTKKISHRLGVSLERVEKATNILVNKKIISEI